MIRSIFSALLLVPCLSAQADTDVFISGQDGYNTYRIPAIIVTTNKTVLAFCEGRKNSRGDSGKIDLLQKRSTDSGQTWSAQQIVWADGENCCGNPTPVIDASNGNIWLLLTWNLGSDHEREIEAGRSKDTRRAFVTVSKDDGLTWAKPMEIPAVKKPEWRWYATGPGVGIQLTRGTYPGRLVIPANHTEANNDGHYGTRSHVFYSDDHGQTWQLGGSEEAGNESTIVELSDGTVLDNMRSKNYRDTAASQDGGLTWSPIKKDKTLIDPRCEGSILRWTWPDKDTKSRILFSNPAASDRENMTVRVSYDEGATWPVSKVVNKGPSGYSCLAILPDKTVGCLYECGKKKSFEKISLARVPVE